MNTIITPDATQKIQLLSDMARLDCDGDVALTPREQRKQDFLKGSVVQVQAPTGPKTVMRTLLSSACEKDCHYCPFRAGRSKTVRVRFKPDELAGEFDKMQQAGVVDGLFLSSGIIGGGVKAMTPMLDTVDILRRKHAYTGYIHLKIMPGAERAQVEQAVRLADRVSVNLEGANSKCLDYLAPQKDLMGELLTAMRWVHEIAQEKSPFIKIPSLTTQLVVGPAGETDHDILKGTDWLYRHVNLSRAYYSRFSPISDTPLANVAPTPAIRQHRLYQADWLLRFYGFKVNELPFDTKGDLPSTVDPKLAWAKQNLAEQPIEINQANRTQLLRIPGIGPHSADAILEARRQGRLQHLAHLKHLGAVANRAAPFILINGQRPPHQLALFS